MACIRSLVCVLQSSRRRHRQGRHGRSRQGAEARRRQSSGSRFDLEHLPWSADHYLADRRHAAARRLPACCATSSTPIFVGALGDPRVPDNRHARDILLGTRFELDLYVNYRPVRLLDDRLCRSRIADRKDINFVVFRENTEGVYVSIGGRFKAGTDDEVAIQEEINTYKGVHRIIRHAFEYAATQRADQGLHGRQEQRHAAGTRAVAARVQAGRGGVSRHHRDAPCTSTRWRCSW